MEDMQSSPRRLVKAACICLSTVSNGQRSSNLLQEARWFVSLEKTKSLPSCNGWLRCRLSFASIRSAIMCIRGSRSSLHRPVYMDNINLVSQEGRVPPWIHNSSMNYLWYILWYIFTLFLFSPSSIFDCYIITITKLATSFFCTL